MEWSPGPIKSGPLPLEVGGVVMMMVMESGQFNVLTPTPCLSFPYGRGVRQWWSGVGPIKSGDEDGDGV